MKFLKLYLILFLVFNLEISEAGWIKNLWNKTFNRKEKTEKAPSKGKAKKDEYSIPTPPSKKQDTKSDSNTASDDSIQNKIPENDSGTSITIDHKEEDPGRNQVNEDITVQNEEQVKTPHKNNLPESKILDYTDHEKNESSGMFILSGSEKLEYSKESDFKKAIEKIAAKGETLNFQIKLSSPCDGDLKVHPTIFSFKPYTMIGSETKIPSSNDLKIGKYYDALVPMDDPACPDKQEICKQSKFRWVDVTVPRDIDAGEHYITISQANDKVMVKLIIKNFTMPIIPSMPFRVPISNWATMLGHCPKDKDGTINSCKKNFELHQMYNKALRENRMEPYDNAIVNDVNNKEYFDEVVSDCRNTSVVLPSVKGLDNISEIAEILEIKKASEYQKKKNISSWFYSFDEPDLNDKVTFKTLVARLLRQKKHAPNVKRMVTTTFNPKLDVDIYCPVVDQFDQPGFPPPDAYKGKELWLYSSCMAHGNCNRDPKGKGEHKKSGTPDFMIDRPAVDQFAFFAQGYKYNASGLLYYNAGENYTKKDPWKDTYDFSGNGDGVLMYPLTGPMNGKKGKFGCVGDAVAPSVRMKLFRQASQNDEWIRAAPDQYQMKKAVDGLIRNTKDWSNNANDFENLKYLAFPD